MTIRTIHIGAGGRGRWPLNRFRDRTDFEAIALVDVNEDNLATARETTGLGEEACFSTPTDALQAVDADAVVVITPPDLHAGQCLEAVRAGKHVLVEKPFTKDLSQARRIVAEATERGPQGRRHPKRPLLSASLNHPPPAAKRRLGPPFLWLDDQIRLASARSPFGARTNTPTCGERGIHDFDQLRHLLDSEPKRLFCNSFNPPWSPYSGGSAIDGWIEFHNVAPRSIFSVPLLPIKGGSSWRLDCENGHGRRDFRRLGGSAAWGR